MSDAAGRPAALEWEFDAARLPELTIGYKDGLIVGSLPAPLEAGGDGQEMDLYDFLEVDADVLVGSSVGVAGLPAVGLVVVHLHYTPLLRSRLALALARRLRRARLEAGEEPSVVTMGVRPCSSDVPDGLTLVPHPVRLRDGDRIIRRTVWEVLLPDHPPDGQPPGGCSS